MELKHDDLANIKPTENGFANIKPDIKNVQAKNKLTTTFKKEKKLSVCRRYDFEITYP